jgi:3-phytase
MRFYKILIFLLFVSVFTHSCGKQFFVRNTEARDDALAYAAAVEAQARVENQLSPEAETEPVSGVQPTDDAADDPALWYNKKEPVNSVVYGSNKKAGIHAYDLKGNELQFVPCGKINNVDVRQGIKSGMGVIDVVAGSNRSDNSVSLFILDKDGRMDANLEYKIALGKFEPYGFCLGKTKDDQLHAFVNNKKGEIFQLEVDFMEGELKSTVIREFKVKTQPEGMVFDDDDGVLYIGEEQAGIHYVSLLDSGAQLMMLEGSSSANPMIHYDVEGISLFSKEGKKYLLASIQGSFSYAIFDLSTHSYLTSFSLLDAKTDGVEETDGLDILQKNLGSSYESGILVVQDGFNKQGEVMLNQNFKYVSLAKVLALVK